MSDPSADPLRRWRGYDPTLDFETFAFFTDAWRPADWESDGPNFNWAYITWWGGHPASFPARRATVRRWVSDVSGHANVVAYFRKADTGTGDGTGLQIYLEGTLVFDRSITFDDGIGFTESVPVLLAPGSAIDFVMLPVGNDSGDTTTMWARVQGP